MLWMYGSYAHHELVDWETTRKGEKYVYAAFIHEEKCMIKLQDMDNRWC